MKILITNDDGIHAPGLDSLRAAARKLGEVHVVAPLEEQSGVSHSTTLTMPLRAISIRRRGEFFGHAITGAPSDCVKLALASGLTPRPEVILSGVNLSPNLGVHVLYSGTIAAAREGAMRGVPSIAISMDVSEEPDFGEAAEVACEVIRPALARIARGEETPMMLNVNIPALPRERIRGVRVVPQCAHPYEEGVERRTDPRGRAYYWLTGGVEMVREAEGTDVGAFREGCVTITPLHHDLTDREWMERLSAADFGVSASEE